MNIAIFNSFNFHYEMFGYIIYWSKKNNYKLSIFTPLVNNLDYITFYKDIFGKETFNIFDYNLIYKYNFDYVILTTDDDQGLNMKKIKCPIISIDHYYTIRNKIPIDNHIAVRPFATNYRKWALPCYVINKDPIIRIPDGKINICIIGGPDYNFDLFKRFISIHNIVFHIMARKINTEEFIKNVPELKTIFYESISTQEMIKIINAGDYVLCNAKPNKNYKIGYSMSGSIPLAISLLKPIILFNDIYKFKNICDISAIDGPINIDEFPKINYESYKLERKTLIAQFANEMIKIQNKNTALIVEPRLIEDLPRIILDYYNKLGTSWHIVFYCGKGLKKYYKSKLIPVHIEIRELEVNNFTADEYSTFFKRLDLWENLYGNYVLVFQYDTYILNKAPYNIDYYIYLNQSYIGGNMAYKWLEFEDLPIEERPKEPSNYNGGLSLRNRLHMIQIINYMGYSHYAEDVYFTIGCIKLNLKFGNIKECNNFAIHTIYYNNYFGIHKPISGIYKMLCLNTNICNDIKHLYI